MGLRQLLNEMFVFTSKYSSTIYLFNVCSRSHCIINIRCTGKNLDREGFVQENNSVLTVVDLAGAEREKKTGNQVWRFFLLDLWLPSINYVEQCLWT